MPLGRKKANCKGRHFGPSNRATKTNRRLGHLQVAAAMTTHLQESIKNEPLWQDRDIRFDCTNRDLSLRKGESIIEAFESVEDTKGNSGDIGTLTITNLRCVWQSKNKPRINLSVGLGCIISVANKSLHSKVRGKYDAIHIMSKSSGTRYEFIFTLLSEFQQPLESALTALAMVLGKVCKAYNATKLYRDLKLRSALFTSPGKKLKTLPTEQIYNKINGVWNLSSDQGNLGTMHITSVRVVWNANLNELFNLSLPYIQISGIRIRESKFGPALVIESSEFSGGYVLGFRIDPADRLHQVHAQLLNLYNVHALNPVIGVECALNLGDYIPNHAGASIPASGHFGSISDQAEFVDEDSDINRSDSLALYMAQEDVRRKESQIVFSNELGLAIEKLKDGFTLESLWNVIQPE